MTPSLASGDSPFFSIIVPVFNGGATLAVCLQAIAQSTFQDWELIVVDDGSTDHSAAIATEAGAVVLATQGRKGPGAARNFGAAIARGSYLCFIDADCQTNPDALAHLAQALQQQPELDAVFGSYDDNPAAGTQVAQFKNLLHHYVHQTGHTEASTFWAGCGAVRRSTFLTLGGFDTQRYSRPCIEDIELGYRIRQAGGQIRLVKQAQVKHFKAWTLWTLIKTDVCDRGIPWTILLQQNRSGMVNDLNLKTSSRISVVLVYGLLASVLGSLYQFPWIYGALGAAALLLVFNWDVYLFFYQKRGLGFALSSVLLHWLYFFYGGVAFAVGMGWYWLDQFRSGRAQRSMVGQPSR